MRAVWLALSLSACAAPVAVGHRPQLVAAYQKISPAPSPMSRMKMGRTASQAMADLAAYRGADGATLALAKIIALGSDATTDEVARALVEYREALMKLKEEP